MLRKDAIGDRMKSYEVRESGRRALPGVPVVLRLDGRGFSQFTKGMARPWDTDFADVMLHVTKVLVEHTNALVGYTQSDEISLVLDPWSRKAQRLVPKGEVQGDLDGLPEADLMFGGRFQKMVSVSAGLASTVFALKALEFWPERVRRMLPHLDCRAFELPNRREAVAVLAWREADATKNAVSMAAQAHFTHKELHGCSSSRMQEMLFQKKGINFNDYPARFKRGAYVRRQACERMLDDEVLARIPTARRPAGTVMRMETVVLDLPPVRRLSNPVKVLLDGDAPLLRAQAK